MGKQFNEKGLFTRRRFAQQGNQALGLLGRQRQWRNSERGTLRNLGAIAFEHRHE